MVVMKVETDIIVSITASLVKQNFKTFNTDMIVFISWHHYVIPVNPPLFAGVSRVRALSPTWTGSHAQETLISRTISPQQKNQGQ